MIQGKVLSNQKFTSAVYDSDIQVAHGAETLHTVDVVTTKPNALIQMIYTGQIWSRNPDIALINFEVDGTEIDANSEWPDSLYSVSAGQLHPCTFIGFTRIAAPGTHSIEVTWEVTADGKIGENCYGTVCGTTQGRSAFKIVEY